MGRLGREVMKDNNTITTTVWSSYTRSPKRSLYFDKSIPQSSGLTKPLNLEDHVPRYHPSSQHGT